MSLPLPRLDTEDFESLFEQARARIPQYAPEWTDHNTHDPGITLIELIAFLVDADMYQVGFLSDEHYIAFAALLGITPQRAKPAQGLLWPPDDPLEANLASQRANLDAGAEVRCVDLPDLGFRTTANVHFTAARLIDQTNGADAMDSNAVVQLTAASTRRLAAIPLSAAQQTHDTTSPFSPEPPFAELLLDRPLLPGRSGQTSGSLSLGIQLDGIESAPSDSQVLPGRLQIDYRIELEGEPWWRVEIELDETQALNYSGIVLFRIPPQANNTATANVRSRLRIQTRGRVNPQPPRLQRIALNVLPIEQLETRPAAAFSHRSYGVPNDEFELTLTGLPEGAQPTVQVEDNGVLETWKEVDDLTEAGPDDAVYELRITDNLIVFGNGVNGRIPARDVQIRHLDYSLTEGNAGNLAPGLSWEVSGAPVFAGQGVFGVNPAPITGGEDAWTIQHLRRAARERALDRSALLTNDELRSAAVGLPGLAVNSTDVLAGNYPGWPDRVVPGGRSLVLRPDRADSISAMNPTSPRYIDAVRQRLLPRRVLGERLSILAVTRIAIRVRAHLLIEDGRHASEIQLSAVNRLNARLSDIRKLTDVDPWPINRPVTTREMRTLLAQVPGVVAVTDCAIAREATDYNSDTIALGRYEIAIGAEHELSTQLYAERTET